MAEKTQVTDVVLKSGAVHNFVGSRVDIVNIFNEGPDETYLQTFTTMNDEGGRFPFSISRSMVYFVGDEYEQAKVIFAKIRNLVEAAGGVMADVVKVTIFVTDIREREKVWRARREVFTGDFPASTLVQVAALAEPTVKVEIEAIAHLGAGRP